jgi:hypothetical protein
VRFKYEYLASYTKKLDTNVLHIIYIYLRPGTIGLILTKPIQNCVSKNTDPFNNFIFSPNI